MAILLASKQIYNIENSKIIDNKINSVSCKGYYTDYKDYKATFSLDPSLGLQVFSEGFIENASKIKQMTIRGTVKTKQLQLNEAGEDFVSVDVVSKDIEGNVITENFSSTFSQDQLYSGKEEGEYEYDALTIFQRTYNHSDGGTYEVKYTLSMTDNMRAFVWFENGAFVPPDQYFTLDNVKFELEVFGIKSDFEETEIYKTDLGNSQGDYFKIEANELLQSSSDIPKTISQNIITEWKNGKETAKIRCSISEYYNQNGTLTISSKLQEQKLTEQSNSDFVDYTKKGYWAPNAAGYGNVWFSDISRHNFGIGRKKIKLVPNDGEEWHYGTIRVGDSALAENCSFFVDMDFGKEYTIELGNSQTLYFHFNTQKPSTVSIPYPEFLFDIFVYETNKMVFDIGDTVIPMVFGADGKDRPMSRYSDGNPKQFTVVGRKMIYDGAVWQELTLQEYTR